MREKVQKIHFIDPTMQQRELRFLGRIDADPPHHLGGPVDRCKLPSRVRGGALVAGGFLAFHR